VSASFKPNCMKLQQFFSEEMGIFNLALHSKMTSRHHDIQYNDIRHKDTQHIGLIFDTQLKSHAA
jgi:hypothetical protein